MSSNLAEAIFPQSGEIQYRDIIDRAGTSIVLVDLNLTISYANQGAIDLLKTLEKEIRNVHKAFTHTEVLGIDLKDIRAIPSALFEKISNDGDTAFSKFVKLGKEKVHVSIYPVSDNNGRHVAYGIEAWYATEYLANEKRVEKVNNIAKMIDEIAFQTNILAVNASIEATHAGEHGKGFGVIASEVKLLADKCRHAAKEIQAVMKN